jgi:DNA-binding NarL/FixJ family response regulator
MQQLRVLVVDDHPIFSEVLAARLGSEPHLTVAVAERVDRALAMIEEHRPSVILLDYMLGDESGLTVLEAVRRDHPQIRVAMLSAMSDPIEVTRAIRLGACAWVPKSIDARQLVAIVEGVAAGHAWLPGDLLAAVLHELTRKPEPAIDPLSALTAREREVLQCMIDGLPRAEIAARLFLSANTVRTHMQNLLAKLDCHSALEAVALARRSGMIPSTVSAG